MTCGSDLTKEEFEKIHKELQNMWEGIIPLPRKEDEGFIENDKRVKD